MGYRNPITTATAVDTGDGNPAGVRLYQSSDGRGNPMGVIELDDGVAGDTPGQITRVSFGGLGGGRMRFDAGSFAGVAGATLDLLVDQGTGKARVESSADSIGLYAGSGAGVDLIGGLITSSAGTATQPLTSGVWTPVLANLAPRLVGMSATANHLVVTTPGWYLVSGGWVTSAPGIGRCTGGIFVNGAVSTISQSRHDATVNNTMAVTTSTVPYLLNAGDTLQLGARQDTGGTVNLDRTSSYLSALYIGSH